MPDRISVTVPPRKYVYLMDLLDRQWSGDQRAHGRVMSVLTSLLLLRELPILRRMK